MTLLFIYKIVLYIYLANCRRFHLVYIFYEVEVKTKINHEATKPQLIFLNFSFIVRSFSSSLIHRIEI